MANFTILKQKQKRKPDDMEDSHPAKKQKSLASRPSKTPTAKKEKVVKEKKPPKAKKSRTSDVLSTPVPSSVDRRKSGRSASARKSYADRDSSDDDEEMLEGVASWEYENGSGAEDAPEGSDAESEVEEEVEKEATPEVDEVEEEPEPAPDLEPEKEAEDEVEPTPPRSNGKKTPRSSARKPAAKAAPKSPAKPAPKAALSRVTKSKKDSPAVKSKGKAPIAKANIKWKGKSKAKDIFDMDESD
jgi:sister-chromatid-cohesion protein PDS5